MGQYETLLKILDCILKEAPGNYATYHPDPRDTDKLNIARSKAFVHLYLKVKCGLTNFNERHSLFTDGSQDGGIDAYYIDQENKKLILIQSKFRTNPENFVAKSLTADDLVKIEVTRILQGQESDSNGKRFSGKILQFQREWARIPDHGHYIYKVIILGNLTKYNNEQILRLLDCQYEIFDFNRTYKELVFPLCSGTYYDPEEICIKINLYNKAQSALMQTITTRYGNYDVNMLFVPVEEVASMMDKYKNSLLKYNPRNYLSLSSNKINKSIRKALVEDGTNEFAIFNNGITILSEDFSITLTTGEKYRGQIILKKPQIINGGQTAYTLSRVFDEIRRGLYADTVFQNKEVLFKIIVMKEPKFDFIERISDATNKQTSVEEADRRSNLEIQTMIQSNIYNEYGYFYERKKGEFFNGFSNAYVTNDEIINRNDFLKAYLAFKGNPKDARTKGKETLFRLNSFNRIIDSSTNYRKMFFAWKTHKFLDTLGVAKDRADFRNFPEFSAIDFGFSLRYGNMAVISAIGLLDLSEEEMGNKNIDNTLSKALITVIGKWKAFEDQIKTKDENKRYFSEEGFDFDNYYKGGAVNTDIKAFFGPSES